jgi:adenylate cyclase class 2
MPVEIEKKYRLTKKQRDEVTRRLGEIGVNSRPEEFEENTLYRGGVLDVRQCVLRLRRVGSRAFLTYKERFPTTSAIKTQREDETEVADAEALAAILEALEYQPRLVYEKRRTTWEVGDAEVVVDELPFGLFMEIEASELEILRVEKLLAIKNLRAEPETYPRLSLKHGSLNGNVIEARFKVAKRSTKK